MLALGLPAPPKHVALVHSLLDHVDNQVVADPDTPPRERVLSILSIGMLQSLPRLLVLPL